MSASFMSEFFSGLRAYYKGTSLQALIQPEQHAEFMTAIKNAANKWIRVGLEQGQSLSQIGAFHKAQMDAMEDGLCRTQAAFPPGFHAADEQTAWCDAAFADLDIKGAAGAVIWFTNIALLLKLKVIENDDSNGWLEHKVE